MVQVQVFLQGGGWHFSYLIFQRFIIFTFRSTLLENCLCRIYFCILQNYAFEEKLFLSATIIL